MSASPGKKLIQPDATDIQAEDVYRHRFKEEKLFRNAMWKILCAEYFQKFIPPSSTLLELASGYCEFINNIQAKKKIAVDINGQTIEYAGPDVKVLLTKSTELGDVEDSTIDVVFVSNFFEHISKPGIVQTIKECYRVLKVNGRLLILQPNIRYTDRDYWMFFDHITPIDDRAMCECLEIIGFHIQKVIPRFLPFTTKGRLPRLLFLVKLYLKLPFLYPLFGGQAFIVARK
jgi:ubiquinone/menaquinone biosynthesis C-methylase UbiE